MGVANSIAQRSTCSRLNVGAVITRNGRILSSGYNGAPSGMEHCNHMCTCSDVTRVALAANYDDVTHEVGCLSLPDACVAVHAEANAIVWAARTGVATEGADLFTTDMPCIDCAQLIINAGIVRVVYGRDYRLRDGLQLLTAANIMVVQI